MAAKAALERQVQSILAAGQVRVGRMQVLRVALAL
jgi:hypothetical protein